MMVKRKLLTEAEAAKYIGMSKSFLAKSRCEGARTARTEGPPWAKIGRYVRYDLEDLKTWICEHKRGGANNA